MSAKRVKMDFGDLSSGGISKGELLWENSNPSVAFASQVIPLDLSSYKCCIVEFNWYTSNQVVATRVMVTRSDESQNMYFGGGGILYSGVFEICSREVQMTDNGIGIGTCYYGYTNHGVTTQDTTLIPTKIYGFKNDII